MKFSITKEVFEEFEDLSVGVIIAEEIDNSGSSEELEKLLEEITEMIRTSSNPTDFANDPLISPWKTAYFEFDKKPHKTHSSVERLTNQIFETGDIERKNKLKDTCSLISLKYTIPIECFDISKIQGELKLARAKGKEHFYDGKKIINPEKGEIIYSDKTNVLARKLDYSEADTAKAGRKTKKAIIMIEGLKPLLKKKVEKITKETADLVNMFCKAKTRYIILDTKKTFAEI